jgi:hypothetical protein
MQLSIKTIFVIATFFLHYMVMRDMALHGGSKLAPILAMVLMSSVFLTAWIILLWNRKQEWLSESMISIFLGFSLWCLLFDVSFSDFFLLIGILSVIAFGSFMIVSLCSRYFIERFTPWLFFFAILIGSVIAVGTAIFKDELGRGFIGIFIFPSLAFAGALTYFVVLPFVKIMFPLYVWVFIKTDKKLFTRYGAILIIFPIVAFFTSSHGIDVIQSIGNPCYEVVEGKAPNYVIRGNNVCIVGGGTGLSTSYLKPLEGADAQSFEDIGSGYAKDKNNVYRYGVILPGANPQTFKVPSNGGI